MGLDGYVDMLSSRRIWGLSHRVKDIGYKKLLDFLDFIFIELNWYGNIQIKGKVL